MDNLAQMAKITFISAMLTTRSSIEGESHENQMDIDGDLRHLSCLCGMSGGYPSINCVFGEREGNIGYMTVAAIPIRSKLAPLAGRAAHEGWTSETDWQGIVPYELLPQVINPKQGWPVSANHRAIGQSEPPQDPRRLTTYELWAQGRLHPGPLSREKVEQLVKSRKTFSPYKK